MDREISGAERQVVEAAEAMPEDRFDFSPEGLKIPGKHVAASNYFLFASVTGEKIPDDFKGGNGPAAIKTKAEILKFLKDSFAVGHRAAGTLTPENMLQPNPPAKSTRFHYGAAAAAESDRSR